MEKQFSPIPLAIVALLAMLSAGADWSQFRGPGGSGVSSQTGLPAQWNASQGVVWKTDLPGFGASSPIVLSQHIYLTCYSGYGLGEDALGEAAKLTRHVVCYDLQSGTQVWSTSFAAAGGDHPYEGFLALHGYASSTPVSDGESVYAFFGKDGVAAVAKDGTKKWQTRVGTKTHGWGSATSPVLFENLVIVNASVESGSLVALDKYSGREMWRASGIDSSWSTPALVTAPGGSVELVVSSKNQLLAFHPSSGEKLWWCDAIHDYICPSVISHEQVVFAIGGRSATALAVKAGGRGDVTDTHRLWVAKKGSNVSSPVYYEGNLYFVHDSRGTAYCLNAQTGETVYEERLSPRPDRIYASPLIADGKIYLVDRKAGTFVLAAKPEFQLLAHNPPLDDGVCNGSPVAVDGKLILRSDKRLYCLAQ